MTKPVSIALVLASLLLFIGASTNGQTKAKPDVKKAEKTYEGWPESRGKALNDPGPAKLDLYDNSTLKCKTDSDCNSGGHNGNICTETGICLCDASQGKARCGKEGNQDCSDLVNGLYCGACGRQCPKGQLCNGGKCGTVRCAKGETFCTAHCSNLQSSNFDCGQCGRQCKDGKVCVKGRCER